MELLKTKKNAKLSKKKGAYLTNNLEPDPEPTLTIKNPDQEPTIKLIIRIWNN